MTKAIGPSFSDELQAAGLMGLPFTWGADGSFEFSPAMTPEQTAAVMAVYGAHDPAAEVEAVPDLATQLAALLITKGTITADEIHPDTLAAVDAQLSVAGLETLTDMQAEKSNG